VTSRGGSDDDIETCENNSSANLPVFQIFARRKSASFEALIDHNGIGWGVMVKIQDFESLQWVSSDRSTNG